MWCSLRQGRSCFLCGPRQGQVEILGFTLHLDSPEAPACEQQRVQAQQQFRVRNAASEFMGSLGAPRRLGEQSLRGILFSQAHQRFLYLAGEELAGAVHPILYLHPEALEIHAGQEIAPVQLGSLLCPALLQR